MSIDTIKLRPNIKINTAIRGQKFSFILDKANNLTVNRDAYKTTIESISGNITKIMLSTISYLLSFYTDTGMIYVSDGPYNHKIKIPDGMNLIPITAFALEKLVYFCTNTDSNYSFDLEKNLIIKESFDCFIIYHDYLEVKYPEQINIAGFQSRLLGNKKYEDIDILLRGADDVFVD